MWISRMFVRRAIALWTLLALLVGLVPLAHALSVSPIAHANESLPPSQLRPLGALLNSDGSLRPSLRQTGPVDTEGWTMTTAPNGAPRFVPVGVQQPAGTAEGWNGRFGTPGVQGAVTNARVYTLALADDGSLYVGGDFDYIGNNTLVANDIARWDGYRWHALGTGVNGTVNQLAVSGNNVYAVGDFTRAGTVTANGIARWNGTTWSAVGTGVGPQNVNDFGADPGRLFAVAVSGADVYVGGDFNQIDDVPANTVARWNGSAWAALGRGIGEIDFDGNFNTDFATVRAMAIAGGQLYVGGRFNTAGNVTANAIAVWNGNAWSTLGNGLAGSNQFEPAEVAAIAVGGNTVYAGGKFTRAGGQGAANIARWDGSTWRALGSGITSDDDGLGYPVAALLLDGTTLYVGGDYDGAGGQAHRSFAEWDVDAQTWGAPADALGDDDYVRALALADNDTLFVGGDISKAGPVAPNDIAALTSIGWHTLGQGFGLDSFGPGTPRTVTVDTSGHVYVGGNFLYAGGVATQHVARWDGDRWYDLGAADGLVEHILVIGDDVYAAGAFTEIGGIKANHVARWNGLTRQWTPLGAGMDGSVYALAYEDGILYAGGVFKTAGTIAADDVAYWDGTQWHPFGQSFRIYEIGQSGFEVGTYVNALDVVGDTVFIGGRFRTISPPGDRLAFVTVNNVVAWTRSNDTWSIIGTDNTSTEPGVTSGGSSGPFTLINSLAFQENTLFVGGAFNQAGATSTPGIAQWDAQTNTWSGLGAGVTGEVPIVDDLSIIGSDVWVAGDFTTAGNVDTPYLARFDTVQKTWRALGSGTQVIRAFNGNGVFATPDGVYFVGNFEVVGGLSSSGIARWDTAQLQTTVTTAGGSFTPSDGIVTQFPSGAVPRDTTVIFTGLFGASQPPPPNQVFVRSLRLSAFTSEAVVNQLAQPYTLRIAFTDAQLTRARITDPGTLNVLRRNGAGWTPLFPCSVCSIDTTNKVITVTTDQIAEFALVGQPQQPQQPATATATTVVPTTAVPTITTATTTGAPATATTTTTGTPATATSTTTGSPAPATATTTNSPATPTATTTGSPVADARMRVFLPLVLR